MVRPTDQGMAVIKRRALLIVPQRRGTPCLVSQEAAQARGTRTWTDALRVCRKERMRQDEPAQQG